MSQDVFQIKVDQIIEWCAGVTGIHDTVAVYGKTAEEPVESLLNMMWEVQDKGLVFNSQVMQDLEVQNLFPQKYILWLKPSSLPDKNTRCQYQKM